MVPLYYAVICDVEDRTLEIKSLVATPEQCFSLRIIPLFSKEFEDYSEKF